MEIAICDDDRDSRLQTVRMVREALERRGTEAVIKSFADAAALLAARAESSTRFDAYFLDVLMPGMDGMSLANRLREQQPEAPIVFLTTSQDYTFQAFSVDAAHYLVKPLDASRLDVAIDRVLALLPKHDAETLVVKTSEGDQMSVSLMQIVMAESDGHYQNLLLEDGCRVRCRLKGAELMERQLATGVFVSAGKGVLLGVRHIRSLVAGGAVLADGKTVFVSRRAQPEVRQAFFRYNCR